MQIISLAERHDGCGAMKRTRAAVAVGRGLKHPELKELVWEASHALASLDMKRLEELAHCCQALNRELAPVDSTARANLARQAREAADEMAIFSRVIDATRANLNVMNRLRDLRAGRFGYGETQIQRWPEPGTGSSNGNH